VATAIQVILAGRPVKILAAYLSPSRPLIGADLTSSLGWGMPVLMAGGLNAEHETEETLTRLCRRGLLSDLWTGHPNHQPIQPIRYSGCLGHRDSEGPPVPGFI